MTTFSRLPEFINDLSALVNINSYTFNPEGITAVGECLRPRFEALGFNVTWVKNIDPQRGNHFFAAKPGSGKGILLVGHLDTVFPPHSPFQRFSLQDTIAVGPGVYDMKGGVLVILYALEQLAAQGLLVNQNITVALMGDEENTAQPWQEARAPLIETAKNCSYGLGFEFARGLDRAVINRRGITAWDLKISTQGGHSSVVGHPTAGQGAVYLASQILADFHQLMQKMPGITINPGILGGGSELDVADGKDALQTQGRRNIIATQAFSHGDIRYLDLPQFEQAQQHMQAIIAAHASRTANVSLSFSAPKPALVKTTGNENLLHSFSQISVSQGGPAVHAVDPLVAGAADMNMIGEYLDSLDGLGLMGGNAHAENEWIDIQSIDLVIQRVAQLLQRIGTI